MRSIVSLAAAACVVIGMTVTALDAQRGHGPKATPPGQTKAGTPPSTKPAPATSAHPGTNVQAHLTQQPQLAARLQTLLLPATVDVHRAADGFSNLGRFVATVHASHNLNIPFDQLKARVTGPSAMSLGQAIHATIPNVNATVEVRRAEAQAREDLKSFGGK